MDAKEAVTRARRYAAEMFADEDIQNLGLEEIVFDGERKAWNITVGFFRAWDRPKNFAAALAAAGDGRLGDWTRRTYKVVRIDDATGAPVSIIDREFAVVE